MHLRSSWVVAIAAAMLMASVEPVSAGRDTGLLSRLDTAPVEPGVVRILHDGVRDLAVSTAELPLTYGEFASEYQSRGIVAGLDGSVWILERDRFFALGEEPVYGWTSPRRYYARSDSIDVTRKGTLWRASPGHVMRSLDGDTLRIRRPGRNSLGLDMDPRGRVWTMEFEGCADPEGCRPDRIVRWNASGWEVMTAPKLHARAHLDLVVSARDEAWLCCRRDPFKGDPGILRYDGRRWRVQDSPSDVRSDIFLLMDSAEPRTLWVRRSSDVLERYERGRWTTFDDDDGVPPIGYVGGNDFLRAAPDGGVWVTPSVVAGHEDDELKCDGVAHFDGESATHFLRGHCILAMDVDRDGTLWLQAARVDIGNIASYRINEIEPLGTFAIAAFSDIADPVVEADGSRGTRQG